MACRLMIGVVDGNDRKISARVETVPSPLVAGAMARLVKVLPTQPIIDRWMTLYQADIHKEFDGIPEVFLYQCDATGYRFFRPVEAAGSMEIYGILQQTPQYYEKDKWEHRGAVKDLRGCAKIAEIGAGSGRFVRLADANGLSVEGFELSNAAVEKAQADGVNVKYGDVEELARRSPASYDAACCFQVLEHIAEPLPFIKSMVEIVRPGGKILFSVPNDSGFLRHIDEVLNLPPHHMGLFTREALSSFGKFLPVKLEQWRKEPLQPGMENYYLEAKLNQCKGRPLFRRALLNRVSIPLFRGILQSPLRICFTGHSMYAVYRRLS